MTTKYLSASFQENTQLHIHQSRPISTINIRLHKKIGDQGTLSKGREKGWKKGDNSTSNTAYTSWGTSERKLYGSHYPENKNSNPVAINIKHKTGNRCD